MVQWGATLRPWGWQIWWLMVPKLVWYMLCLFGAFTGRVAVGHRQVLILKHGRLICPKHDDLWLFWECWKILLLLLCLIRVVFVRWLASVLILKEVEPRFRDNFGPQKTYWRAVANLMINLRVFKVQTLNVHDILEGFELLLLEFVGCLGMRAHIWDVVSIEMLSCQIIMV